MDVFASKQHIWKKGKSGNPSSLNKKLVENTRGKPHDVCLIVASNCPEDLESSKSAKKHDKLTIFWDPGIFANPNPTVIFLGPYFPIITTNH